MKNFSHFGFYISLLLLFSAGCDTGYRADIRMLLAPSSLPYLKSSKLIQVSGFDTSGGDQDRIVILPGKKNDILQVEGPGMIVRIWFGLDSEDPWLHRHLVIRMFWDNEEIPSVEVPFGDFFGNGFKYQPFEAQYLSMTGGGYLCTFPMPFERMARIELSNEGTTHPVSIAYQIGYQKFEGALESDVSYFHALWNRSVRTSYDSNYHLLSAVGKGHIVGINLNIQSYDGHFDYLNGDEMFFVDGEKRASFHGTGTDHYFGGIDGFSSGPFSTLTAGLIYKDETLGRIAAYRFHTTDPIPFRKSIKVTFEHGHGNKEVADYSSTVYWYQMEPHQPFPPMLKPHHRIPLRVIVPVHSSLHHHEALRDPI